jgi:hypothetical protein
MLSWIFYIINQFFTTFRPFSRNHVELAMETNSIFIDFISFQVFTVIGAIVF